MATRGEATTFEIKNKKNKKPYVRFNILDEGYPFKNEGIA